MITSYSHSRTNNAVVNSINENEAAESIINNYLDLGI